jgi:hypothetical protein
MEVDVHANAQWRARDFQNCSLVLHGIMDNCLDSLNRLWNHTEHLDVVLVSELATCDV